jgi:outer membrane protein OmpA-like peptidoglycan-associated protein
VKNLILCPLVLVVGCATAQPPQELVAARAAYRTAAVDAARAAPVDLHAAKVALDAAEASFAKEPKAIETRDRAYVAQRRAELATTNAAIFVSGERREASNDKLRSVGAAAAKDLRTTKEDLSDSQRSARVATRDAASLRTDLQATQTDLEVQKTKSDALTTNLARSETELLAEKQARRDAEQKLTATLQAMSDLQSVKEEARGLVITLSGAVLFASGKSVLLPAAQRALNDVAEALKASPNRAITVEGHTDSQGTNASNQELSRRRGEAVRAYLVSRGVAAAGITSAGFGPDRPIADNATTEGRANNRRVEIVLAPEAR